MNYSRALIESAYNKKQLYHYLLETHKELKNNKGYGIYKAGHFFNRAYGLDLTETDIHRLGQWIYKAEFMKCSWYGRV